MENVLYKIIFEVEVAKETQLDLQFITYEL